jgi:hypothetical protein
MEHIGCENSFCIPRQKGTFRDMNYSWITGKPESAGLNRHVVGDARALQERK